MANTGSIGTVTTGLPPVVTTGGGWNLWRHPLSLGIRGVAEAVDTPSQYNVDMDTEPIELSDEPVGPPTLPRTVAAEHGRSWR
jgi:hypothetical protein